MGNPFETIADTVSEFAGDIADAWNRPGRPGNSTGGEGKFLSYPNALGNASDSSFSYDSDKALDDITTHANGRAEDGGSDSPEPFILVEFFRVVENEDTTTQLAAIVNAISAINVEGIRGKGRSVHASEKDAANTARSKSKEVLQARREVLEDSVGKRKISETLALYMTPSISVNDSMSYEQESRKLAAIGLSVWENGLDEFSGEDVAIGSALASAAAFGAAGAWLGEKLPGNLGVLAGGAGAATLGQAIGDEALRNMGKALNPNEYMQYKTTQLRTFTFNWKFLPDSIQESLDCEDIIRIFRAAAHAHRKSPVTLTVPDQVVISFHGTSGIPALPPLVISNVSVTYNPNSASFFKQNNNPVEMDLSVTFNEIMPIYRDDVETKGY